jgi:hypothetical protein
LNPLQKWPGDVSAFRLDQIAGRIAGTGLFAVVISRFVINSLECVPFWEEAFVEISAKICANLRRVR